MKILITGGAGYVGRLLVLDLIKRDDVSKVMVIDRKDMPSEFKHDKIDYYSLDLAYNMWEELLDDTPDFVIHCAFDIRSPYNKIHKQEFVNLESCRRVFEYCFSRKQIKKIIYTSSAAAYGPRTQNIGYLLKEEDALYEDIYPYGLQKKKVEKILDDKIVHSRYTPTDVYVLRFSTVNGEEGNKRNNLGLLTFIKNILPIIPYTSKHWARQYINEKDIISGVNFLLFENKINSNFEIFNFTPNDFIEIKDMAKMLGKKTIKIPVWMVKVGFFLMWHLTLGYFPTCRGAWKSFVYPSNMDGSKITKYGFKYKYTSKQTFLGQ